MAIETSVINPRVVFVSATTPSDLTEGKLWYNTSDNSLYVSDGSSYVSMETDTTNINKLIGLNSLNILDITAQASLTAGTNANFERDIYTDSDGYLDTVDAGNTTAGFLANKYINKNITENYDSTVYGTRSTTYVLLKSYTLNTLLDSISYDLTNTISTSSSYVKINYSDLTSFQSDTITSNDYTTTNKELINPNKEKQVSTIQFYAKVNTGTDQVTIENIHYYTYSSITDKIVQTNPQTINAGFTKFMIVSNEETSGTGSVTYDISFNGGTNYQEDLTSFTEYTITDAGTSLILKQNLNAGASSGTASAYNWGVLLW